MIDTIPGGPAPVMPQNTPPLPPDPSQVDPMAGPTPTPGPQDGSQPVTPEQRADILKLINTVRSKLGNFHAIDFANKNKAEKLRSALLRQTFDKLQAAGIDLSDPNSVNEFIQNLQKINPTLAQNFEKAMNVLLGGPGFPGAPQDPTQPSDSGAPDQNMNNENPNEQTTQTVPQV